jgi:hypothetical protein
MSRSLSLLRLADDKRRSGASREVRSRLYFYHGMFVFLKQVLTDE